MSGSTGRQDRSGHATDRPPYPQPVLGEDELLDEVDGETLDRLGELLDTLDPPPTELDLRVRFALDLEQRLDAEFAAPSRQPAGAASGARGPERVRIELAKDGLELLLSVTSAGPVRRVEVRLLGRSLVATADEDGRFVLDDVPPGLAQFVVHRPDRGPIVTTVFEL